MTQNVIPSGAHRAKSSVSPARDSHATLRSAQNDSGRRGLFVPLRMTAGGHCHTERRRQPKSSVSPSSCHCAQLAIRNERMSLRGATATRQSYNIKPNKNDVPKRETPFYFCSFSYSSSPLFPLFPRKIPKKSLDCFNVVPPELPPVAPPELYFLYPPRLPP